MIEIIDNEVIFAGLSNNKRILLHASLESKNLSILIKSELVIKELNEKLKEIF
jgi:hypothetical protein